jgi:hypothetical protein
MPVAIADGIADPVADGVSGAHSQADAHPHDLADRLADPEPDELPEPIPNTLRIAGPDPDTGAELARGDRHPGLARRRARCHSQQAVGASRDARGG